MHRPASDSKMPTQPIFNKSILFFLVISISEAGWIIERLVGVEQKEQILKPALPLDTIRIDL